LCRVVASSVLGDESRVEFVFVTAATRFEALRNGTVDVLMRNSTNTLRRDASFANGGEGVNFGPTYFFDGTGILIDDASSPGIESADELLNFLDGKTVCVPSFDTVAADVLTASGVDIVTSSNPVADLLSEECDAIGRDRSALTSYSDFLTNPLILAPTLSKEPLAPVVADGDDEWLSIIRWSVNAVIFAEEIGITSATVDDVRNFPSDFSPEARRVFGLESAATGDLLGLDADWAYRAITTIGNYGEIYDQHLAPQGLLRDGSQNRQYFDGGLLYVPPMR
jgi:general L-amino acid transport system substrate-binding protein